MTLLKRSHETVSIPLAHTMLYCFHNAIRSIRSIYTTVAPKGTLLNGKWHRCTKKICSNFVYHIDSQDEQNEGEGRG